MFLIITDRSNITQKGGLNHQSGRILFHPNWKLTLSYLLLMPLLIGLGCWQLNRAEEKRAIEAKQAAALAASTVKLTQALAKEHPNFTQVGIDATLDRQHYWLLDNRLYKGKAGYEVIVLAQMAGTNDAGPSYIWVSLGWIAGNYDRRVLPAINLPADIQQLTGTLYRSQESMFMLAPEQTENGWPKRIQRLDFELMQTQLATDFNAEILPWVLYLNTDSNMALQPIWTPTNMSSEKHSGYAFQWFAMATALTLLFLYAGIKRTLPNHDRS